MFTNKKQTVLDQMPRFMGARDVSQLMLACMRPLRRPRLRLANALHAVEDAAMRPMTC
jgi:hypothetical protein